MDTIKDKILNKSNSQDLLAKINSHLNVLVNPSILITSGKMTETIINNGIQHLYENKINFIHTLSCPYSYTTRKDIDKVLQLAEDHNNIIVIKRNSLGIIGSKTSLQSLENEGANIIIVNRDIDALEVAKNNETKNVIMFSCGFDSDTPSMAGLIIEARNQNVKNISVLMNNKLIQPAVRSLLNKNIKIDAYITPGDLAIFFGLQTWKFIAADFKLPVIVGGFEDISILYSLEVALKLMVDNEYDVVNSYSDLVNNIGNPKAQEKTYTVFNPGTVEWKGYGLIPFSGLVFSEEFAEFDANKKYSYKSLPLEDTSCICDEILSLQDIPQHCDYYAKDCTPITPKGSCMGCNTGICSVFYSYTTGNVPDLNSFSQIIE